MSNSDLAWNAVVAVVSFCAISLLVWLTELLADDKDDEEEEE